MKFGGDAPKDPYESIGPQGFPMQLPNSQLGQGYSPGTIRNTLGSGLKSSGFFQKDGQIQNSRGGFIGAKKASHPGTPYQGSPGGQGVVYNQAQVRQLILQPAQEGINGNGAVTISPDNSFLLIANLPPPQMFLGQGQTGTYAAYLVDDKGQTGFLVGLLRSVGNGVYRAHFQSPVPLYHYTRVVVSVENPTQLGQAPYGPIILKVNEPVGMMSFLNPMKNTATTVWGKISGMIKGRKKPAISPDAAPPMSPELYQAMDQMGVAPETMVPQEQQMQMQMQQQQMQMQQPQMPQMQQTQQMQQVPQVPQYPSGGPPSGPS